MEKLWNSVAILRSNSIIASSQSNKYHKSNLRLLKKGNFGPNHYINFDFTFKDVQKRLLTFVSYDTFKPKAPDVS